MSKTTTDVCGDAADLPPEALQTRELEKQIDLYRELLSTQCHPKLVARSARRLAAMAEELERRALVRCPACGSAQQEKGPLGVRQCGACGAWYGEVTREVYRQICTGGWSREQDTSNARYVDLSVPIDLPGARERLHGWVSKTDGKWIKAR